MEHKETRARLAKAISELLAQRTTLPVTLRPYQVEAFTAFHNWLVSDDDGHRAHIVHATGLGKTVVFASILRYAVGLKTIVIVPYKVLVEQTARVIAEFAGGMVGHVSSLANIYNHKGEIIAIRGHLHHDIVVTTIASFERYASELARALNPDFIIWDECHLSYVPSAQKALKHFAEAVVLGVTATPDYLTVSGKAGAHEVRLENGQRLFGKEERFAKTYYGQRLDERNLPWGIEEGYLAPLAWGFIRFNVSLDGVKLKESEVGLDYDPHSLWERVRGSWKAVIATIRGLYKDPSYGLAEKQVVAICPSVKAAEELARAIHRLGVPSQCVAGTTPDRWRGRILNAFSEGKVRFLSSVMVLGMGWDEPQAEVLMMLRPTQSYVLYLQYLGRVLRPKPSGEPKVALVLDAHFQSKEYSPLSAPALLMPPGTEVHERDILVGPRGWHGGPKGKKEIESSYLPPDAKPELIIVDPFDPILSGDEDWKIIADWAKEVWVSEATLKGLLRDTPSRSGFRNGRVRDHYHREVVKEATENYHIPRSSDTWRTIKGWADFFGVTWNAIRYHLNTGGYEYRRTKRGRKAHHYHGSALLRDLAYSRQYWNQRPFEELEKLLEKEQQGGN